MSIEDQVKIYLGDQVLKNIIPASTDEKSQSAILNFATWNLTSSHRLTILGRLWGSGQRRERSIIRRFMLRPDQVPGKITMITRTRTRMIFSDITLSSASLSSAADTDDLSSLGVPVFRPKYAFLHLWDQLHVCGSLKHCLLVSLDPSMISFIS